MIYMFTMKYVTGRPSTEYVSEETPMAAYAHVHFALEQMRVRALTAIHGSPLPGDDSETSSDSPRVLVLGPESSGKTSVCRILTNYAVRAGQEWTPLLVNVDSSEVCPTMNLIRRRVDHYDLKGWLERSRNYRCRSHPFSHPDLLSCQSIRCGSNISTHSSVIKRLAPFGVLVRPRRN
jgi:hypothetical protein